jgi:hypothetical protein
MSEEVQENICATDIAFIYLDKASQRDNTICARLMLRELEDESFSTRNIDAHPSSEEFLGYIANKSRTPQTIYFFASTARKSRMSGPDRSRFFISKPPRRTSILSGSARYSVSNPLARRVRYRPFHARYLNDNPSTSSDRRKYRHKHIFSARQPIRERPRILLELAANHPRLQQSQ